MADAFADCLTFTLAEEGGWANDPEDPGGATMQGVTFAAFTDWRQAQDLPAPTLDDLRYISEDELQAFYATRFWNVIRGHDLPAGIDLITFDFGVNAGWHRSVKMLQQALGMSAQDQDGWVGPQTLGACSRATLRTVLANKAVLHLQHYMARPTFDRFGNGWMHRTARRLLAASDMVGSKNERPNLPELPILAPR